MRSWVRRKIEVPRLRRLENETTDINPPLGAPTVFHITHWKSGSQWVRGVLENVAPRRLIHPAADMAEVKNDLLVPGAVYSPVYMASQWFFQQVNDAPSHRYVLVIRDLRDAAVSWYFSMRYSHGLNDTVAEARAKLEEMDFDDGMVYIIEERLSGFADIQLSWLRRPEGSRLLVRYEDLIADEHREFDKIFDHCAFDATPRQRRAAVKNESFRKKTGRSRGKEKVSSHHRKGVSGDWRNHFSDRARAAFKDRYGELLVETGYERGLDW